MHVGTKALKIGAIAATLFGLATVASGGRALFGDADMGAVVPFVLWFNFIAGFAYIFAGAGLWHRTAWAAALSAAIAVTTAAVTVAFAWHMWTGGAAETRTALALVFRLAVWTTIALFARRALFVT